MRKSIGYLAAVLACSALCAPSALAYDEYHPPAPPEAPPEAPGTSPTEPPALPPGGVPAPTDSVDSTDPSSDSVREAAIKARNRALIVASVTAVAAIPLSLKCVTTIWPANFGWCVLAAVTAVGSYDALKYANNPQLNASINTPEHADVHIPDPDGDPYCVDYDSCREYAGVDPGPGEGDLPGPTPGSGGQQDPEVAVIERNLEKVRENLAKGGYSVDESGNISTPRGTLPASSLTPERLASLGASNEMQAQLRSKIQEEIAAAEKRKESESLVAGGGGSVPSYAAADRKPQQWRQAAHSSRAPASVEGLSVRRGDDLIGVKGADIFDMVHRKYQEERKRTDFLE